VVLGASKLYVESSPNLMMVGRLDRPFLVEMWVHLGGVLTGEEGGIFVAVNGLRGTTPHQCRRTSLGKELQETSHVSRLHSDRLYHLLFFSSYLFFIVIV
jgi:hypothetical protein